MPQSHVPHTPYPYSASISLRCDMHPQRRMRRSGKRERGWGEWGGGDVTGSFPVSVSSEGTCFLACIAAICWLGPLLCSTGTCPAAAARARSARRTITKKPRHLIFSGLFLATNSSQNAMAPSPMKAGIDIEAHMRRIKVFTHHVNKCGPEHPWIRRKLQSWA